MSVPSTEASGGLDPVVDTSHVEEVAEDLGVLPSRDVDLVPNIALVGGTDALLVVDTGLGPVNGARVLELARARADGRELFLTTTHAHPEHASGAQAFAGEATWLVDRGQAHDLATRGTLYAQMLAGTDPGLAAHLQGVEMGEPDLVYDGSHDLDLGGRTVRLSAAGRAHSAGDQVVTVADAGVVLTGDLAEADRFPVFPWFPPHSTDVSGVRWLAVLEDLASRRPRTVVPGHGRVSGPGLLDDLVGVVTLLRDATWQRRADGLDEAEAVTQVRALAVAEHPTWQGRGWIDTAVACFWSEGGA